MRVEQNDGKRLVRAGPLGHDYGTISWGLFEKMDVAEKSQPFQFRHDVLGALNIGTGGGRRGRDGLVRDEFAQRLDGSLGLF